MVRYFKEFTLSTWLLPTLLIGLLMLFAFPLKQGLKADPAVYATIARNVVESGRLWPLSFSPHMFPQFYEHPPFVIWCMALFMKIFGSTEWVAAFFSRLLSLGSLLIVGLIFKQASIERSDHEKFQIVEKSSAKGFLAIVLTLSWIPWLKYVGTGQYEGPLTFLLALALWMFLRAFHQGPKSSTKNLFAFFALGIGGFFVKGIIFLPILFVPLAFSVLHKKLSKGIAIFVGCIVGWTCGALFMYLLDHLYQSTWSQVYWNRILGWGFQNSNTFDVKSGISVFKMLRLSLETLKMEISMSPLWTLPLWLTMAGVILRRPKLLLTDAFLCLSFLMYWAFLSPFMIATIKMPHWPVPIYPIASVFLVQRIPERYLQYAANVATKQKLLWTVVFALATLLATVPYPTTSKWGRGEEWLFHKNAILENTNAEHPLIVEKTDQAMYMIFAYSAWFLGPEHPMSFQSTEKISSTPCTGGLLWTRQDSDRSHISQQGWVSTPHQTSGAHLWQCQHALTLKH